MDRGEQAGQPVGGAGGVPGEVVAMAQDHDRFGPHTPGRVDAVRQTGMVRATSADDEGDDMGDDIRR
jgi:hypothetical protein